MNATLLIAGSRVEISTTPDGDISIGLDGAEPCYFNSVEAPLLIARTIIAAAAELKERNKE